MAKVSKYGQWKYPGQDTIIPNANGSITMKGVPYPVLGIDDLGNQQIMMPGVDYQFPGNSVYEIPMMAVGGLVNPCPPGKVPDGKGNCVDDLTTPPIPSSSLYNYYMENLNNFKAQGLNNAEEIAGKMVKSRRTCKPGDECWEPEKKSVEEVTKLDKGYYLIPTDNPGVAVLNYRENAGNGKYISKVLGPVHARDFLNDDQQREFFGPNGGVTTVDYDPETSNIKIYPDMHSAWKIIDNETFDQVRKNQQQQLKENTQRIEAEKEMLNAPKPKMVVAPPGLAYGGAIDPERPWKHKYKSQDGNYRYKAVGTNGMQDYDDSTVRRTLKGFISGAPKPTENSIRKADAKFEYGGVKKVKIKSLPKAQTQGPIEGKITPAMVNQTRNELDYIMNEDALIKADQEKIEKERLKTAKMWEDYIPEPPKVKKGKTLFGRDYQIVEVDAGPDISGLRKPGEKTKVKTIYYKNGNIAKSIIENNEHGDNEVTWHDKDGNVVAEKTYDGYRTFSNGYFDYINNVDYETTKRRNDEVEHISPKNKLDRFLKLAKLNLENMSREGSQPGDSFNTVWPDWENDRFNYTRTKNPEIKKSHAKFAYGGYVPKAQLLGEISNWQKQLFNNVPTPGNLTNYTAKPATSKSLLSELTKENNSKFAVSESTNANPILPRHWTDEAGKPRTISQIRAIEANWKRIHDAEVAAEKEKLRRENEEYKRKQQEFAKEHFGVDVSQLDNFQKYDDGSWAPKTKSLKEFEQRAKEASLENLAERRIANKKTVGEELGQVAMELPFALIGTGAYRQAFNSLRGLNKAGKILGTVDNVFQPQALNLKPGSYDDELFAYLASMEDPNIDRAFLTGLPDDQNLFYQRFGQTLRQEPNVAPNQDRLRSWLEIDAAINNRLMTPPSELVITPQGIRETYTNPFQLDNLTTNNTRRYGFMDRLSRLFPSRRSGTIDLRRPGSAPVPERTGPINKSSFTKEETKNLIKDKSELDKLDKLDDNEFSGMLVTPDGKIKFPESYTPNKNVVSVSSQEWIQDFNDNIDLLNKIIRENNTSGRGYQVIGIEGSPGVSMGRTDYATLKFITDDGRVSSMSIEITPGRFRGDIDDIANADYMTYGIPGIQMKSASPIFGLPVRGTKTYESLNEYLKRLDLGRVKSGMNVQSEFSRPLWEDAIKKGKAYGFYASPGTVYGIMKQEGGQQEDELSLLTNRNRAFQDIIVDDEIIDQEIIPKAQAIGIKKPNFNQKLNIPLQFQQAPNLADIHVNMPHNSGWGDFITHRVPSVYDAVRSGDPYSIEEAVNKYLGYPMDKAYDAADRLAPEGEDPIDSFRHPAAAMYTQQAIKDKVGVPILGDALGFLGANASGIGHELSTIFKDERPWDVKLREAGEDAFNNFAGSVVGLLPGTQDQKANLIYNMSLSNWLPDGVVSEDPNKNMYLKDEQGNVNRDTPIGFLNKMYNKQQGGLAKAQTTGLIESINNMYGINQEPALMDKLNSMMNPSTSKFNYARYRDAAAKYLGRDIFKGTPLTPDDIASAAQEFYNKTSYEYPLDLLLAQGQMESKLGKTLKSQHNYFNIGNTDEGAIKKFPSAKSSVLEYMNLMYNDYLDKGKKSPDDLLKPNGFVNYRGNRYASNPKYESDLAQQRAFIKKHIGL